MVQRQGVAQWRRQRVAPARKFLGGLPVHGFQPEQWRAAGLHHRVLHLMGVLTESGKLPVAKSEYRKGQAGFEAHLLEALQELCG